MSSVGERIKRLRKERGWTQAELAKRVNKSPQVISNWERDYTSLSHDDVAGLARAFQVPADVILETSKTSENQLNRDLMITAQKIEELARKYNLKVSDPEFQEILTKAFDLALIVNRKETE